MLTQLARPTAAPRLGPARAARLPLAPLRISGRNDAAEREADSAADQVMRGERVHLPGAAAPALARKCAGCGEAAAARAPPTVAAALRAPGRPLDSAARAYFEPRFGASFADVRVHADAAADSAARAIDARAFTLGRRIGFAAGEYAPATRSGRHLLAHELAHAVQSGDVLRRQSSRAPAVTATQPAPAARSSKDLWADFAAASVSDPARATAIARELIPIMSPAERRADGIGLLFWLLDHGIWDDAARQLVDNLASAYMLAWAADALVIPGFTPTFPDPAIIANRAQAEAGAGRHVQASSLFGLAFHLCELLLLDLSSMRRAELARTEAGISGSERRQVALAEAQTSLFMSATVRSYPSISRVLSVVRDILGYYPREERRALLAGDQAAARQASGLGLLLRMQLLGGAAVPPSDATAGQVITMESVAGYNSRGQRGYTLQAVAGPREVVTPLPGAPSTADLGLFPDLHSSFPALAGAIAGQEEFVTEIYGEPEVRRAFRARPPDMTEVNDRLRVWSAMYRAYQRQDTAGLGALYSLMSLMGRYLRTFTAHTVYNVRDFGVSYLSSRFPTDLAGRTVQDCGVYALTVAYELYRTARAARPRLNLDFRLYAQPEHVMLAIFDGDTHYIVTNDQVLPGRLGGPASPELFRSLANAYGRTFGRPFVITPMQSVAVGTTGQTDSQFRNQAWQRYQIGTQWGFPIEPSTGPADARSEAERSNAPYRRYYEELTAFNAVAGRLQQALDAAVGRAGASRTPDAQRSDLQRVIGEIFAPSLQAARIFDAYGPHAQTVAGNATARRVLGDRQYLFTHAVGASGSAHPLTRMAMMLLRFQRLGGTLTPDQERYINWIRSLPAFAADLAVYRAAGDPQNF